MTKPIDDAWIVTGAFFVWMFGCAGLALILPPLHTVAAFVLVAAWAALVIWAAVRLGTGPRSNKKKST